MILVMIPKVDVGVGEVGFIFCGTRSLLMTSIQVKYPVYKSHLVFWFMWLPSLCALGWSVMFDCGVSQIYSLTFCTFS